MDWSSKCKNIKAVVFDIDGTMTDGSIGYGQGFDEEFKFFSVKDGTAIAILRRLGIKTAALTGRHSSTNQRRMTELHVDIIKENCHRKGQGLLEICQALDIKPENCMYLGDDLIDLVPFALCGISVAVADSAQEVLDKADWVTRAGGGKGALREATEKLLKYQGRWEEIIQHYYDREKE